MVIVHRVETVGIRLPKGYGMSSISSDALNDLYTAIVLPTRYGKSDVIRCTAIQLYRGGHISAALVLNPNRLLRDQLVDSAKVNAMVQRYQIAAASELKYCALEGRPSELTSPTANGEFLVSATIQLITEQINLFEHWVEHMAHRHDAPVLVYIDEAQTGSEKNQWGAAVERLVRRGACACLLTATPMRADGLRIPGFDFEVLQEKEVKRYRVRDGINPKEIIVDVYAGTSQQLRLKAHHTTTFRQAWKEQPAALCRISRLPFDIALTDELADGGAQGRLLSALTESEARKRLGRIIRNPRVIRAGVESLATQLRAFRGLQPDIAAIVFVGNDDDPKKANQHAADVRACIESIDPSLEVVIATSSDGNDGVEKIQRFARGRGDVLVVKQMASLGLDASRLKVGLDLSAVRTPAACIQRMMRIATPHGGVEVCVLIAPDDCLYRAIFDIFVKDEGGEAWADQVELLTSYPKERNEEGTQHSLFTIDGIVGADFDDSHGVRAAAALRPDVDQIVTAIPELLSVITHAQIAQRLVASGLVVTHPHESATNTSAVADDLRNEINQAMEEEIKRRWRRSGQPYNGEAYRERAIALWTEMYRLAGVPASLRLTDITELEMLKRIQMAVARVCGHGQEL